eukprot:184121_1
MNMNANRNDSRNIYNSSNENGNNSRGRGGRGGNSVSPASAIEGSKYHHEVKWKQDGVYPSNNNDNVWLAGWLVGWLAGWLVGWLVVDTCTIYHSNTTLQQNLFHEPAFYL